MIKSKSKFEYCDFSGGNDFEFVAHAKKFTKQEVVDICMEEWDYRFDNMAYRKPTVDDVKEETVRWYVKIPENCGYDGDGGCYSYCDTGERGSFPVWVIMFEDLKIVTK